MYNFVNVRNFVLGRLPIRRHGPNIRIHEFQEVNDIIFITIKHWELEIESGMTGYPVLDSLMKCGRILCTKLMKYRNTRGCEVMFIELAAFFWVDEPKTIFLELREIKSGRFEIKTREETRVSLWKAISSLFTNILNSKHLISYSLFSLTMSSECESILI